MKKNKAWIFLILIIPVLLITISTQRVKADSGFDTSYSSSSSGSSYSSSESGDSSGGEPATVFDWIVAGSVVVFAIAIALIPINANHSPSKSLSEEEIRKYIPDFDYNKFVSDRFNDYVTIQNAWMNFDYDTLRSKLTDELYNQYVMQLDTLKIKGEQNIMNGFNHKKTTITKIYEENGELVVTINSVIQFYDFIVQNGKVVRGKSYKKITHLYEMSFVCRKDSLIDKCPSCHAPLNNNSSQTCEYCGSVITRTGENWVMTKKRSKTQW